MPTNKYIKPKNKVIQVFQGKEVEKILKSALQYAFQSEGITIKPSKVKKVLRAIPQSFEGGKVVLIVEHYPLSSMEAHGKFKDLVYQVIRKTNTQYARKFKKSKNPRTPPQQANRGKMGPAVDAWHLLSPAQQKQWNKKAYKLRKTGYNLFISTYLKTH